MNTNTRTHVATAWFRVLIALAVVAAFAPAANAQSPTWSNTGTNFNLGANWSSGAVPTTIANFNNAAVAQPNLTSTLSIQRLSFNASASGYVLTSSAGAQINLPNATVLGSAATSGFNTVSAAINLTHTASGTAAVSVTGAAPLVWNGPITATNSGVLIAKNGAGTLFMGSNSYTGPFGFDPAAAAGTIVIDSIRNVGGGASSLGAPATTANGTIRVGSATATTNPAARLRYVGGTNSTDRVISLDTGSTSGFMAFMLQASGVGPLTWSGNFQSSGASQRYFWLSGISDAANTFSGVIASSVSGTTGLFKNGAGNWTLTGANTYVGQTLINGGTLTVDYQQGGQLSSGALQFGHTNGSDLGFSAPTGGGTLRLVAKSSGATTQTVGALGALSGPTPGVGGQSLIVLDPNGGSGITLHTGTWTLGPSNLVVLKLPAGATLTTGSVSQTHSLINGGASAGAVLVEDSSGMGFATLSGSNVVRYTSATALTASTNNSNGNFSTSGNLTMTAGTRAVQSLDVNTTGGGTLNLGNQNFAATAILFTGSGDYNITSGTVSGNPIIHQHSTGLVTLNATAAGTGNLRKGGAGTLALTTRGGSGYLGIYEGALRADGASVYSTGNTVLGGGGVLELGGAGNFTGATGTAAGQIRWIGDGGFSAFGAVRTVQLGGNSSTVTWGSTHFVPDDNALVLSNVNSNNTIDFQNGLDFGAAPRLVRVHNGSAAIDARLSGVLSGNYGGGLFKTGAGTLELTNANTYLGETVIDAGMLRVSSGGSINSSQRVLVNKAGAELRYNSATALTAPVQIAAGTISGDGTISAAGGVSIGTGAILSPGNSPGLQSYTTGLTWAAGGSYLWEINDWTGGAGTAYDQIAVSGSPLNITATSGSPFTILITSLTGANAAGNVPNFDGSVSKTFTIATSSAGISGFDASKFTLNTSNFTNTYSGSWSLSATGSTVLLNYNAPVSTTTGSYSLSAAAGAATIIAGGSSTITATITNTGAGTADAINYSSLGVGNGVTISPSSGSNLAQAASGTGTGVFTSVTPGLYTFDPTASVTNSTLGGAAVLSGSTATSVTVLDHATSSLSSSLTPLLSSTISLGTWDYQSQAWTLGTGTGSFSIFNLNPNSLSTSLVALLDLTGTSAIGDTGFTLDAGLNPSSFTMIAGGTSAAYSVSFDPTGLNSNGTYTRTFTFQMADQNLPGGQATNTLTLTAVVLAVPEPSAVALAGIGMAAAAWARRRRRS